MLSNQSMISHYLQNLQSGKYDWKHDKTTLYSHLCELLEKVKNIKDIDKYQKFEMISDYIKRTQFQPTEYMIEDQLLEKHNLLHSYPLWIQKQQKLIKGINASDPNNLKLCQVHLYDAILFQQVGISFGQKSAFKINCALKKLANKYNAVNIRFWGKIIGIEKDYYVIQGIVNSKKKPVMSDDLQLGQGANKYTFWVNQSYIDQQWYELPLITPKQLNACKVIKHVFRGELNSKIKSYPSFDGDQKHFLKAQLVRITHNCEIVPKGLYTNQEQNVNEIQFTEQFKFPEFSELANLQNWVHLNPYLLNLGRASYYINPSLSQEQKEQLLVKYTQNDPKIERLKAINEDKGIQNMGIEGCWLSKVSGNSQVFSNVGKDEGSINCYGFVSLRNCHWPGWLTVCSQNIYSSIYIGYGFKSTQAKFHPMGPDDLQLDSQDVEQFSEPNPKQPPDELQPDSDQEISKDT